MSGPQKTRLSSVRNPKSNFGSAYGVGSPTNPSLHCPHRGARAGLWAALRAGKFAGLQRTIYAKPCAAMAGRFTGLAGRVAGLAGALLFACLLRVVRGDEVRYQFQIKLVTIR